MTVNIQPVPHAEDVKVHVFVEDTSYADAPAVILLHEVLSAAPGPNGTMTVKLPDLPPDLRASRTVRVLVDIDGDGRISSGDWISTESHPLVPRLNITLRRV